jgi:hypothetical protein
MGKRDFNKPGRILIFWLNATIAILQEKWFLAGWQKEESYFELRITDCLSAKSVMSISVCWQ